MSFEKAIKHNKVKRKAYRGSKRFDSSCRNHGNCGYCKSNRLYQTKKALEEIKDTLKEIE